MLADVGMMKTYSKSAHVNDLGFVWTGPPPCYYGFSARWFCHTLQVRTAPSLHLPLSLEETFLHAHKAGPYVCLHMPAGRTQASNAIATQAPASNALTGHACCGKG